MFEIYSVYGKLMDRIESETDARRCLATWPLAWTLAKDGKVIDVSTRPLPDVSLISPGQTSGSQTQT